MHPPVIKQKEREVTLLCLKQLQDNVFLNTTYPATVLKQLQTGLNMQTILRFHGCAQMMESYRKC